MKSEIEQIRSEINRLEEKLKQVEARQHKFKQGDWVVENEFGWLIRINEIYGESIIGDYFYQNGRYYEDEMPCDLKDIDRLATKNEIETALRKEWDRRCKEAGWESGDEVEIEGRKYRSFFIPHYSLRYDRLWTGCGSVYHKGKWATPKPKKSKIVINGYEAEFKGDVVKFGCAKIDLELFDDLDRVIHDGWGGNRFIESVTIGQGTFTKEDIERIVNHDRSRILPSHY